jgi:hypothetical protein
MSRLASSKTAQIWAERFAQFERSNAPVAPFCQSIGCAPTFSPRGVVQRVRRTSSPSAKAYRWINRRDGLEVRRTRRSKRKLAAAPQATAVLRLQTSDSNKDSIEIKLPEAGQRLEAIGETEQPNSRKTLVRSSAEIK